MAEPKQPSDDGRSASVKVLLTNDVRVNGTLYPAGSQEVPREQAEDIQRIDAEHNRYLTSLLSDNGSSASIGNLKASSI